LRQPTHATHPLSLPRARGRAAFLLASAATLAVVMTARPALAADPWPQYQGGAAHAGSAAAAPAPPYAQAWTFDVPPEHNVGVSAPIVAGDLVVTVGPSAVYGVDLATGQQRWSIPRSFGPNVPAAVGDAGGQQVLVYTEGFGDTPLPLANPSVSASAAASGSPSPSATPAASPLPDTEQSRLVGVDLSTQKQLWTLDLGEVSRTGVTIDGTTAFVGDNRGNLYAVDITSGKERWTAKVPGFLASPLTVSGGTVLAAVQAQGKIQGSSATVHSSVVAFDAASGDQSWTFVPVFPSLRTTDISVAGETAFVGFDNRVVEAIDIATGIGTWTRDANGLFLFTSSPAISSDAVILSDSTGHVIKLAESDGARRWDFALNTDVLRSAPVLAGNAVLVTSMTGRLSAIDVASGRLVFQSGYEGGSLGAMAVTPNLLITVRGGDHGGLIAFRHDDHGRLVSIASPTTPNPGKLVVGYAAAAVPLLVILLFGIRPLAARLGPPEFEGRDDDEEADEDDGDDGDA
jgi:outer membrane protein assembly factor BamB